MYPLNPVFPSGLSIVMWTPRRGSPFRSGSHSSNGSGIWSSHGLSQILTQSRLLVRNVDMSKRTTASPVKKSTIWFGVSTTRPYSSAWIAVIMWLLHWNTAW